MKLLIGYRISRKCVCDAYQILSKELQRSSSGSFIYPDIVVKRHLRTICRDLNFEIDGISGDLYVGKYVNSLDEHRIISTCEYLDKFRDSATNVKILQKSPRLFIF